MESRIPYCYDTGYWKGTAEEWAEMIWFYGKDKVIHALKKEIKFLADYAIEEVCAYFPLRKEELLCDTRKLSRPGHWFWLKN